MTEVNNEARVQLSEQEVFDRLVELNTTALINSEDTSQLKKDVKFNKKTNPKGIPTARLSDIAAAAKLEAQAKFEEFAEKSASVKAAYEEFTQYND